MFSVNSFKSNIYNHQNDIGTNHCHLNDRSSRKNVRQSTPLAGKMRYLLAPRAFGKEDTTVERVGHDQGRLLVETKKITSFVARRRSNVVPEQR